MRRRGGRSISGVRGTGLRLGFTWEGLVVSVLVWRDSGEEGRRRWLSWVGDETTNYERSEQMDQ